MSTEKLDVKLNILPNKGGAKEGFTANVVADADFEELTIRYRYDKKSFSFSEFSNGSHTIDVTKVDLLKLPKEKLKFYVKGLPYGHPESVESNEVEVDLKL